MKRGLGKFKQIFEYSGRKQIISYVLIIMIIIFGLEGITRGYQYFGTTCTFLETDVYPDLDYFEKKQICEDARMIKAKHVPLTEHIPNQHTSTFNVNNYGFRGPDITLEKPDETFRIFTVGSSTTRGAGSSSDSTTMAGFLQYYLEKDDLPVRIEVINAGMNSYFSLWESELIKNKILKFSPDVIIAYSGFADLDTGLEYHKGKKYQTSIIDKIIEKTFEISPEIQSLQVIRKVQADFRKDTQIQALDPVLDDPISLKSSETTEKVQMWKDRWIEICNLGKEKNFDTLIFLQPIAGGGNKILSDMENAAYEKTTKYYVNDYKKFALELNELNNHCTGVKVLRNVFDDYSYTIFTDGIHTVDGGNRLVAEEMYSMVLPIIQEKKK